MSRMAGRVIVGSTIPNALIVDTIWQEAGFLIDALYDRLEVRLLIMLGLMLISTECTRFIVWYGGSGTIRISAPIG